MDSIETARLCWPWSTYFLFASCHVRIDYHDVPHVTSRIRPSPFSAYNTVNMEGPGDCLHQAKGIYPIVNSASCNKQLDTYLYMYLVLSILYRTVHNNTCRRCSQIVITIAMQSQLSQARQPADIVHYVSDVSMEGFLPNAFVDQGCLSGTLP